MNNPNDFDNIVFLVPKDVVEEQDYGFVLNVLDKLIKDKDTIRKNKDKVTIGFGGYDKDPREIYEIHEVRDYIKEITLRFPYWYYFCSKSDHSLRMIHMAHCRFKKFGSDAAKVDTEDFKQIMTFLFIKMNGLFEKYSLDEAELKSVSKEIEEYFSTKQIPSL